LREPVHDNYAYLERDLTEEEKEQFTIEVVLPAGDEELHGRVEETETDVEDWF